MDTYILNVKKSPSDSRDWKYAKVSQEIPSSLDYRPELQTVRNQGSQGACYAFSAACVKEWQDKKDYGLNEWLAPQYIYNHRDYWNDNKQEGDDINEDYGMFGRDVMRILKNIGVCLESEYPYLSSTEKHNEINKKIKENALKHKISGYARVDSINSLKMSLFENGPCLITFPVYNYGSELWKKLNTGDKDLGGHAMSIVGYTDQGFIIRNSWGKKWGKEGYSVYKYNDWGCHWEIWTVVDAKTVPTPPPAAPTPPPPTTDTQRPICVVC